MSKAVSKILAGCAAGLALGGAAYQRQAQNYYDQHFSASFSNDFADHNFVVKTVDGLELKGLFLEKGATHRYLICINDRLSSLMKMLDFGRGFWQLAYNVILFDGRGQGLSEGVETMGLKEQFDVASMVDWVLARDPEASISLFGVGTGALAALMALRGAIAVDSLILVNSPDRLLADAPRYLLPAISSIIKKELAVSLDDNKLSAALACARVPICFVAEERYREESLELFEQYQGTRKYYPLHTDLAVLSNDPVFFKNIHDFIISIVE